MPYPDLKLLIAGEWTDGSSGRSEPVICPADGSTIGTLPHASPADLDAALAKCTPAPSTTASAGFR